MSNQDNAQEKMAAYQSLIERHFMPTFITKLASSGVELGNYSDLAHATQLSTKFSAMLNAGMRADQLVNAVVDRLHTKKSNEDEVTPLTLSDINQATDSILKRAGHQVDESLSYKQADALYEVSDDDLNDLITLHG